MAIRYKTPRRAQSRVLNRSARVGYDSGDIWIDHDFRLRVAHFLNFCGRDQGGRIPITAVYLNYRPEQVVLERNAKARNGNVEVSPVGGDATLVIPAVPQGRLRREGTETAVLFLEPLADDCGVDVQCSGTLDNRTVEPSFQLRRLAANDACCCCP